MILTIAGCVCSLPPALDLPVQHAQQAHHVQPHQQDLPLMTAVARAGPSIIHVIFLLFSESNFYYFIIHFTV